MDDENNNLQSELSSLIEEKEQLEASLAEATDNKPDQVIRNKYSLMKGAAYSA